MQEVQHEAERRKVELLILPTLKAIEVLQQHLDDTNAILHVTCQEAAESLHQIWAIDPESSAA
jgi:HEAT repeat protein